MPSPCILSRIDRSLPQRSIPLLAFGCFPTQHVSVISKWLGYLDRVELSAALSSSLRMNEDGDDFGGLDISRAFFISELDILLLSLKVFIRTIT